MGIALQGQRWRALVGPNLARREGAVSSHCQWGSGLASVAFWVRVRGARWRLCRWSGVGPALTRLVGVGMNRGCLVMEKRRNVAGGFSLEERVMLVAYPANQFNRFDRRLCHGL